MLWKISLMTRVWGFDRRGWFCIGVSTRSDRGRPRLPLLQAPEHSNGAPDETDGMVDEEERNHNNHREEASHLFEIVQEADVHKEIESEDYPERELPIGY